MYIMYIYKSKCIDVLRHLQEGPKKKSGPTRRGLFDDVDDAFIARVQVAHLTDVIQGRLKVSASCLFQRTHRHFLWPDK